eukprot:CAMPEP_0117447032 /NCGR_PEP_ID=MMETSP0759-20121206/6657_1 /TAXON_ID=63605 /ORGANISM="Percolomonas cosmopolitus, Strain WS" /LENGTH=672 /DNA_ID=CAMNT_0005239337 /DNA_START=1194 /DNA_END=3212 /DNA_ORIENTATION=+
MTPRASRDPGPKIGYFMAYFEPTYQEEFSKLWKQIVAFRLWCYNQLCRKRSSLQPPEHKWSCQFLVDAENRIKNADSWYDQMKLEYKEFESDDSRMIHVIDTLGVIADCLKFRELIHGGERMYTEANVLEPTFTKARIDECIPQQENKNDDGWGIVHIYDIVVIMFAGHGAKGSGDWYLGRDTNAAGESGMGCGKWFHAVVQRFLATVKNLVEGRDLVIVSDSCHSGHLCTQLLDYGSHLPKNCSITVQTACSHEEEAYSGYFLPTWRTLHIKSEQHASWSQCLEDAVDMPAPPQTPCTEQIVNGYEARVNQHFCFVKKADARAFLLYKMRTEPAQCLWSAQTFEKYTIDSVPVRSLSTSSATSWVIADIRPHVPQNTSYIEFFILYQNVPNHDLSQLHNLLKQEGKQMPAGLTKDLILHLHVKLDEFMQKNPDMVPCEDARSSIYLTVERGPHVWKTTRKNASLADKIFHKGYQSIRSIGTGVIYVTGTLKKDAETKHASTGIFKKNYFYIEAPLDATKNADQGTDGTARPFKMRFPTQGDDSTDFLMQRANELKRYLEKHKFDDVQLRDGKILKLNKWLNDFRNSWKKKQASEKSKQLSAQAKEDATDRFIAPFRWKQSLNVMTRRRVMGLRGREGDEFEEERLPQTETRLQRAIRLLEETDEMETCNRM